MIKLTIQGEPDEIAAFLFHLEDCAGISLEYKTGISKRALHHKWGSALAGLHIEAVTGLEPEVTIYSSKRGSKGESSTTKAVPGYVYVMPYYSANGIEGYKIGKTTNPYSRRRTFSIKLNFQVTFIALIHSDNHSALETAMHQEFAKKRRGSSEWFNLTPEDVAAIQALMSDEDKKLLSKLESGK
jgi:arginine utilization protein RocB